MAYITQTDIENKLKGSAVLLKILRSSAFDATALAVIASAIAESDGVINSYAEGTSGYPWSVTPQPAKTASLALCIWRLYALGWPIPTSVKAEYDAAMEELKQLAGGKVSWVTGTNPAAQNTSKVFVWLPGDERSSTNPRRSTRSQLDGL